MYEGDGYLLELCGSFRLSRSGEPVSIPLGGQRLMAYLALGGDRHRRTVTLDLWPGHDAERAVGSLRSVLWRINRLAPDIVVGQGAHLHLNPVTVRTDVEILAASCRAILQDRAGGRDTALVQRRWEDLLVAWDDEWLALERQQLRQLRLHAQECFAESCLAVGDTVSAIEATLRVIGDEPLRETAHRCLVKAHLAEGNYAEAFRQYGVYRGLLYDALGVAPSPQMELLLEPVRATGRGVVRGA